MVKKMLEDLIRLFHERQVVEKIAQAEEHTEKYEEEKIAMKEELENFKIVAKEMISIHETIRKDFAAVFNKGNYVILPEDAVEVFFICMMTGINDDELLEDYESLSESLRQVKGELAEPAEKMAHFLSNKGKGGVFSEHKEEELLKQFFS